MRKVILQEFVSLNGLAAGPGESVNFVPASMQGDEGFGREQEALMDAVDGILLGRVTYEMFAAHWPNATDGEDKRFAEKLNALPKIVFSNSLARAPWGRFEDARIVRGRAEDEVAKLRQQPGKDLVLWGSLSLAQSLMRAGLVDEYRLVMCPLTLPEGRALFEGDATATLTLQSARPQSRGAVCLTYTPSSSN